MNNQYDVIVVGAGPAGISVSFECSKAGLSVLLIEESELSESEKSWITFQSALDDYPLLKKAVTNTVNRLKFYGAKGFFDSEPTLDKGYFIEQSVLNKIYETEIKKNNNCRILEKTLYLEAERKNNFIEVQTSQGSFIGKIIVDASGSYSVVAKDLMIPQGNFWLFMCYFLRIHKKEALSDYDCVVFSHGGSKTKLIGQAGALYPNSNSYFDIGVANYLKSGQDTGEMKTILKEQIVNLWHFFQKQKIIKNDVKIDFEKEFYSGIRITPRKVIHSDNLVIIGDAAGQGSPITGEGLRTGLYYGKMAAQAIIKSVEGNNYSKNSLKLYSLSCKKKPLFKYFLGLIVQIIIRNNIISPPFKRFQKIYNKDKNRWQNYGLFLIQNNSLSFKKTIELLIRFIYHK